MADPTSELRNILMTRTSQQQQPQAPAAQPPAQPYAMSQVMAARGQGSTPPAAVPRSTDPAAPAPPAVPSSLLGGLKEALIGSTGSGSTPKAGINPPSWPGTPAPMGPGDIPVGVPNESAKVPPRWERFQTAQHMIDGYRNGWSPNPMLVRIMEGNY